MIIVSPPVPIGLWIFDCYGIGIGSRGTGLGLDNYNNDWGYMTWLKHTHKQSFIVMDGLPFLPHVWSCYRRDLVSFASFLPSSSAIQPHCTLRLVSSPGGHHPPWWWPPPCLGREWRRHHCCQRTRRNIYRLRLNWLWFLCTLSALWLLDSPLIALWGLWLLYECFLA